MRAVVLVYSPVSSVFGFLFGRRTLHGRGLFVVARRGGMVRSAGRCGGGFRAFVRCGGVFGVFASRGVGSGRLLRCGVVPVVWEVLPTRPAVEAAGVGAA